MKHFNFIFFLLFFTSVAKSQAVEDSTLIYAVEVQAEYKNGGMSGFLLYMGNNFKLPRSRKSVDADGKLLVKFFIDSTGDNHIEEIINNLVFAENTKEDLREKFTFDCEEEIRRIFLKMPKWKPGTQNNIPVKSVFTMPFRIMTR